MLLIAEWLLHHPSRKAVHFRSQFSQTSCLKQHLFEAVAKKMSRIERSALGMRNIFNNR